jgi:hypothetical protein
LVACNATRMSCGRLWQMPDVWRARCNAAHRESHAIFVQPLSNNTSDIF